MIGAAHHVGIAVKSLQDALEGYRRLGLEPDFTEEVPSQGVRAAVLRSGAAHVELLEPLQADAPSARFTAPDGERRQRLAFVCAGSRKRWPPARHVAMNL